MNPLWCLVSFWAVNMLVYVEGWGGEAHGWKLLSPSSNNE